MGWRLGVDVGGTFTDVVLLDEHSGDLHLVKVPSTPADSSVGVLQGLRKAFADYGVDPTEVGFTVHGTTVATNTIIQGRGARAGLITTEGFRDILEIAYQTRPTLYDIFFERPRPLIPRHLCLGVRERMGPEGEVIEPLAEEAVREATRTLRAAGVEAVVISLLHAYRNPAHERRVGAIVAEEWPTVPVVLSSDICPEFREYLRTSTAVVNAVLLPRVAPYLVRLDEQLRALRLRSGLHLMTSGGGIATCEVAKRQPVTLIESGPAAGVIGAVFVANLAGYHSVLAFDMGGTTAKASLVDDGVPRLAREFEVGAQAVASMTAARGQGYPVKTPVLEIVEVGAGGGSIAAVDPGGALAVGPESAGADPGPACYGLGGDQPTITDANLILGRLDPDSFLGGTQRLDISAAERAFAGRVCKPLRKDLTEAANAVVEIATARMTGALRLVSVEKGRDPRGYTLVASGGAGPMHAVAMAAQLSIPRVLVPPSPGLNSALGLLATDLRHDFNRTFIRETARTDWREVAGILAELKDRAAALLAEEGVPADTAVYSREADMCYLGQSFHLRIPLPEQPIDEGAGARLEASFHVEHAANYGYASATEPTQIAALRLVATSPVTRPVLRELEDGGPDPAPALRRRRPVFFAQPGGYIDCPIYARERLRAGNILAGPAIVEQMDATTVIPPGAEGRIDRIGNLMIHLGREAAEVRPEA